MIIREDWWSYVDESNPEIPSRLIRWMAAIPYIFKIESTLFGSRGFSISVRFLLLSVHFMTDVSCGKFMRLEFIPWGLSFTLGRGWTFSFFIGFSKLNYLQWQTRRGIWRLAKQGRLKELQDVLDDIGKDIK